MTTYTAAAIRRLAGHTAVLMVDGADFLIALTHQLAAPTAVFGGIGTVSIGIGTVFIGTSTVFAGIGAPCSLARTR